MENTKNLNSKQFGKSWKTLHDSFKMIMDETVWYGKLDTALCIGRPGAINNCTKATQ